MMNALYLNTTIFVGILIVASSIVYYVINRNKQRAIKERARAIQDKIDERLRLEQEKLETPDPFGRGIEVKEINDPWNTGMRDTREQRDEPLFDR